VHKKIKKVIIDNAFVLNYRTHVAVEHCTMILIYSTVHDCSHLCETKVLQQVSADHDSSRCVRCALNRLITDIGFILRGNEK
jgi:hypothetical protein